MKMDQLQVLLNKQTYLMQSRISPKNDEMTPNTMKYLSSCKAALQTLFRIHPKHTHSQPKKASHILSSINPEKLSSFGLRFNRLYHNKNSLTL